MFLDDRSGESIALAKTILTDELAIGSVVVTTYHRIHGAELERIPEPLEALPDAPPPLSRHAVWGGVSVTASGTVLGPARPPFQRHLSLEVGDERRELVAFGPRVWERSPSGWTPSSPAPFRALRLGFDRAFGGEYELPAGLFPGTDLPCPALRIAYPLNPGGIGFYRDAEAAAGNPLPSFEYPDALVRTPTDAPEPAGFAPCPTLMGLRVEQPKPGSIAHDDREAMQAHAAKLASGMVFRAAHHATGRLIFPRLDPGTRVKLTGVGDADLEVRVPPSPVAVATLPESLTASRVRAVHLFADERVLQVVYGHAFRYAPDHGPRWIRVRSSN